MRYVLFSGKVVSDELHVLDGLGIIATVETHQRTHFLTQLIQQPAKQVGTVHSVFSCRAEVEDWPLFQVLASRFCWLLLLKMVYHKPIIHQIVWVTSIELPLRLPMEHDAVIWKAKQPSLQSNILLVDTVVKLQLKILAGRKDTKPIGVIQYDVKHVSHRAANQSHADYRSIEVVLLHETVWLSVVVAVYNVSFQKKREKLLLSEQVDIDELPPKLLDCEQRLIGS